MQKDTSSVGTFPVHVETSLRKSGTYQTAYPVASGHVFLEWTIDERLTKLQFAPGLPSDTVLLCQSHTRFSDRVLEQIEELLEGRRNSLDIRYELAGTPFQMAVWGALMRIPYGETRSYSEIARTIGRPRASRAVGMAAHCNPLHLLVPCHRLVGADCSLTGYAGGLELKRRLLLLEQGRRTSGKE